MKTKEVERYADNGQYSYSEVIDEETGKFLYFICPICGATWDNDNKSEHITCTGDNYHEGN